MTEQSVDGHYGRRVRLDLCHPCGAFWFDVDESLALTPGAILRLFVVIGERRDDRRPSSESPTCPRCRHRLARTVDMQRNTRFTYWRCPAEHGRYITFAEFLREKDFVRPLSAAELADLRANVTMIHCSSCGAPVNLERTSTCDFCRAPVSMLDARQVEKAVSQLKQAEADRQTVDPTLPLRLLADRLHVERLFQGFDASAGSRAPGVVETGLAAVADFLAASD